MAKCSYLANKFRFVVITFTFLTNVSVPLCCRNMIYAIQPMVNHTAIRENTTEVTASVNGSRDGPFAFDEKSQSLMLSVLSMGQLLGNVVALFVFDLVYFKPVFIVSLSLIGLLNMLVPLTADLTGSIGVIVSRFITGFFLGCLTPTSAKICAAWTLREERVFIQTVVSTGQNVGNILFALSGFVEEYLGWEYFFYIPAGMLLICSLVMAILYTDSVLDNNFMSEIEKNRLMPTSKQAAKKLHEKRKLLHINIAIEHSKRRKPAPWFMVLRNLQYWALISATFGHSWAAEAAVTYTQMYLLQIHKYTLARTSLLTSIPTNVSMLVLSIIGSRIAEYLIEKQIFSKKSVRATGGVITLSTSIFFVCMAFLSVSEIDSTIELLMIISSFRFGSSIGLYPSFIDISPTYQDSLITLSMLIGVIPGAVVPALIGAVEPKSKGQWQTLFLASAGIIIVTEAFYVFTIKPMVQDFDHHGEPLPTQQQAESTSNDVPQIVVSPTENEVTSNWPLDDAALTLLWTENPLPLLQEAERLRYMLKVATELAKED